MKIACIIVLALLPVAFSQDKAPSADDSVRVKRAGFSLIGGAIQNLQKSAFSASASVAGSSSSSSAGASGSSSSSQDTHSHSYNSHSSDSYDHDHDDHYDDTKSFDGWQLKKSILNTLLQAVKAIAGGVVSLKGQLIKGSGYLVSQKGKLIASGGDAVSDAGRNIIKSAHLIKPESSGHGSNSIGHSFGAAFSGLSSGLTKSISGLSSSSGGSIASLSSGSSGHVASLSSSSSGSSSGKGSSGSSGHGSSGGHTETHGHGDGYSNDEHHSSGPSYYTVPETNYGYDTKPAAPLDSYGPPNVVYSSYGPPKPTISYLHEPQYSEPHYNDGSYKTSSQEASDVLSEILKNLPHKPMKSVGHNQYSGGHSFNQLPIPDDPQPPPFKPLNDYPPYDTSYDSPQSIQSHYGPPNHFSDFSAQGSASRPIAVNPKAYDIYHSMKIKLKKEKNFVTLPTIIDGKGLEIQKSIGFELTA